MYSKMKYIKTVWKRKNVLCFFSGLEQSDTFGERDFLNNILLTILFYFDRLQKRIFSHMALPKRSFVFSHFWLWFFSIENVYNWMTFCTIFVDYDWFCVLCFVLYYALTKWLYDKINTIMYFPTFNCVFCIWFKGFNQHMTET